MIKTVDTYLAEGCMRCKYGGTPQCKVHTWTKELVELRRIVLECGLAEEVKWSMPCYTFQGKNVLMVSAFKQYASINFFKGALLHDEPGLLVKAGENSHEARQLRFTTVEEIMRQQDHIMAYIFEALEIEKAGLTVDKSTRKDPEMPEELLTALGEFPALKTAFESLTPGRQRGYIMHFAQAKQARTRETRIEKYIPKILSGKGLND